MGEMIAAVANDKGTKGAGVANDKEEGTITVPLDEIDARLTFKENPRVRLKYKVQLTIPKRADIKKE